MNENEDARAMCPYYRWFRGQKIQCESCVRQARLVLAFRSRSIATQHKRAYCDTHAWDLCPYACMKNREWEDEHGEV